MMASENHVAYKREKTKELLIRLWEYTECFKTNGLLEIELSNGCLFCITNNNPETMLEVRSSTSVCNVDNKYFTHIHSFIFEHGEEFLDSIQNIAIKDVHENKGKEKRNAQHLNDERPMNRQKLPRLL
jgi:hypothetical protein